jgi:hypothetical protein
MGWDILGDTFYNGRRGMGKTAGAMILDVWIDWLNGSQIWTNMRNIHIGFDKNPQTGKRGNLHIVDALSLIELLAKDELPEDIADSEQPKTLLLDEMKTQGSARTFGSSINRYLTDFVSQARKRTFKIISTDQIIGASDKWIRLMTDKIRFCSPIIAPNDLGYGTPEYPEPKFFRYYEVDLTDIDMVENIKPRMIAFSRELARNFYGCYNTKEIIKPIELAHPEVFGQ